MNGDAVAADRALADLLSERVRTRLSTPIVVSSAELHAIWLIIEGFSKTLGDGADPERHLIEMISLLDAGLSQPDRRTLVLRRNVGHLLVEVGARALVLLRARGLRTNLADRIVGLLLRKNADYGDAWQVHGRVGIIIRLSDKALRIANLLAREGTQAVQDEAMTDTLIDMVGYCLLGLLSGTGASALGYRHG